MPDTKQISVRVSPELFKQIEAARGLVPREPWMRGVLEQAARALGPYPPPKTWRHEEGKSPLSPARFDAGSSPAMDRQAKLNAAKYRGKS